MQSQILEQLKRTQADIQAATKVYQEMLANARKSIDGLPEQQRDNFRKVLRDMEDAARNKDTAKLFKLMNDLNTNIANGNYRTE